MIGKVKYTLLTFVISILLGCSGYQSILNSKDPSRQYEAGKEYYDEKAYGKARILLEAALEYYRGRRESRDILLMLVYSCYYLKEYLMVVDYVDDFQEIFSNDDKLEELIYLQGKTLYTISSRSSLDQTITLDALDVLDDFINRFTDSSKIPEINSMVQELTKKLQKKDKDIIELFHNIGKYKACIKTAENFLLNHSVSVFTEQVSFMKCSCLYRLAIHSIPNKKKLRFESAEGYYQEFYKKYPASKYLEKLEKFRKKDKS